MAKSAAEKIKDLFTGNISLQEKIDLYKDLGEILKVDIDKRRGDLASEMNQLEEVKESITN